LSEYAEPPLVPAMGCPAADCRTNPPPSARPPPASKVLTCASYPPPVWAQTVVAARTESALSVTTSHFVRAFMLPTCGPLPEPGSRVDHQDVELRPDGHGRRVFVVDAPLAPNVV